MRWAAVALVLALAVVVPAGRLVGDRAFRRTFPQETRIVVVLAAAGAGLAVVVALWMPAVAASLAFGAVAAVAATLWWGRAGAGRSRRRPPGDRSLVRSVRDLAHPDAIARRAARFGPVNKAVQPSGTVVHIHGLARGQRFLQEQAAAIGPSTLGFTKQVRGGFLRYMDDPTHDRYGPLFRRAVSRAVEEVGATTATEVTARELGSVGPSWTDPRPMLATVACETLLRSLFGTGADTREGAGILAGFDALGAASLERPGRGRPARALDELRRRVAALPAQPGDGPSVLSGLWALQEGPPDAVCIDNLLFMHRLGVANTTGLLAWVVQQLGAHPEMRARLVDPHATDAFVLECLRLGQSEYLYRRLVADAELDGYRLRKGWRIRICVAEAHRDPSLFPDPEAFTDRFLGTRPPQSVYSPFGFGRHACNAAGLATGIARSVLEVLVARPDIEIRPADERTRDLRHWSHWRPGPSLAVRSGPPGGEVAVHE